MDRRPKEKETPHRPKRQQAKRTSSPLPEDSVPNGHHSDDEESRSDNSHDKHEDSPPNHKGDELPKARKPRMLKSI